MSKHSPAQLRQMALHAMEAKRLGDHRYLMLVITVAERTGLTPKECEQRIEALTRQEAA